MGPCRERTLLVQGRPARPAVASRIIHLQTVRRIRTEQLLEPCFYSPVARCRCCTRAKERITTAKHPQLASNHCRAWHVNATGHVRSRCPRVSRNVVVIQRVQVGVRQVTPTSDVDVSVDDAKARSSQRSRHTQPAGVPGVEHWIVLPYLAKRWIYRSCGVTANQVDLPVEITRAHEGAHIGHRRSCTPG